MKKSFCLLIQLLGMIIGICMFNACETIHDVNGSFEESLESGRISSAIADGTNRHFFRFHLRQFEHDIGGVFESFDMSAFTAFKQVPVIMTNATNFYYCARIDYGYVRDNNVYVKFTDREQRQWTFSAPLGDVSLSGQLYRTQYYGGISALNDAEYLLPEDASFRALNPDGQGQIVLDKLEKSSSKSLNCIYYYKKMEIDVVLPENLDIQNCKPSVKQCRSIKLALVGSPGLHRIDVAEQVLQTVQTAYLDDCDLSGGWIRHLILRDNPYIYFNTSQSELFVATLIVYEDLNLDGVWNSASEPILASLDGQSFVFYSDAPSAIYGKNIDGVSRETPVLNPNDVDSKGGWFLFKDESELTDTAWRTIGSLKKEKSDRVYLSPLNRNPELTGTQRGCYIKPVSEDQVQCKGILPVLIY